MVDNALRESASRIEQQWENLEILRLNAERLRSNDELRKARLEPTLNF